MCNWMWVVFRGLILLISIFFKKIYWIVLDFTHIREVIER